jgi:hypothetical protein
MRGFLIAGSLFAILLAGMFRDHVAAEWHARDAERQVVDLANKIPDNATRERVAEVFASGNFDYLTLQRHDSRDQWFFHTPYRLGATDWILVVTFGEDHVVAVRVGTSDDVNRRPEGAPADRTAIAAAPQPPCLEEPSQPEKLPSADAGRAVAVEFNKLFEAGQFEIGYCLAEVQVNENGTVDAVRLLRPEDADARVESVILRTITSWQYRPARACGRPVPSTTSVGFFHCPFKAEPGQHPEPF